MTRHPATITADNAQDFELDELCERMDPDRQFLRSRWFSAGPEAADRSIDLRFEDGRLAAVLPLRSRTRYAIPWCELAGGYWPLRSPLIDPEISGERLATLFADPTFGGVLRIGPTLQDDPAASHLVDAAELAGWSVLDKHLGTIFELDLPAEAWPSSKTLRKNRWRRRRLEESGELEIRSFSGRDWTAEDRNAMAAVEAASWLGKLDDGGDTKFADPDQRRFWEDLCDDPVLASMLNGSLMTIGGEPAAFVFGLDCGTTRYCIANNFDARFAKFGPGRVLLYADFEHARDRGITRVSWGSGDMGYKTEMGAVEGPELRDLLFVRNRVLALTLKPVWEREA